MIVGSGLLARSFAPRYVEDPDVIIFASGVSSSLETRPEAFQRERDLLQATLDAHSGRAVYFGSCAVGSIEGVVNTPYLQHKRDMERLVLGSKRGLVLRLPQVVGPNGNPNTLSNFLHASVMSGNHFSVWGKAERNLMDIDDIVRIATVLIDRGEMGRAISIAGEHSIAMPELVAIFARIIGKPANLSIVDQGSPLTIDSREASEVAAELGIDLGIGYAERVIRKYYRHAERA